MVRLMPRDFMCPLRRIMDVANYLEPYGVATGAVLEWICISQNFNDRRAQPRGFVRQPLKQESRSASQSGQLKLVLLVLQPVGCLSWVGGPRFREVLRMCRTKPGKW